MTSFKADSIDLIEKGITLRFHDVDSAQLMTAVGDFFEALGYKDEGGSESDVQYGKGSVTLALLFGAFVKRYRFYVKTREDGPQIELTLEKGMSGAMSGIIGMRRMKKEMLRLCEELEKHFA